MTPAQRLERDVHAVQSRHGRLLERHGENADPDRLLVVLSAASGAERHLPRSVPELLAQTRAVGRSVDLLIGCNDGFEADETFASLEQHCDLSMAAVFCTKTAPGRPASVVDEHGNARFLEDAPPDVDRCFVVHQRSGSAGVAAGKIRMLGDLYGWIEDSIVAGWRAPVALLACDAESEFDSIAPWSQQGAGQPALAVLLARLENDAALQFVGTRNRFTAFEEDERGVRRPRFDLPLPPIQLYINLIHTRAAGFEWMPGGGTLGRTPAMTAVLATIASYYPSARIEDAMTSVLAHAAGFGVAVEPRVASINRCAPRSDAAAGRQQMERWIAGNKDLEAKYGREAIAKVTQPAVRAIVAAGTRLVIRELLDARGWRARCRVIGLGNQILTALPRYSRIARSVPADRSDDPDFPAGW